MMFVRLSGMGVHCDHKVHVSADLSLRLDSTMFWAPWHQSMSIYSKPSFQFHPKEKWAMHECKLGEELNARNDK